MPMMGSGGGSAQGETFEQLMALLQDPEKFADRKAMLDAMKQDINTIMAESAQRKILVEDRVKDAQKIEVANNFVKIANDKRAAELEAYEITLKQRERAFADEQAAHHAAITQRTSELGAHEQAISARLNAKQTAIQESAGKLEAKQLALAAAMQAHAEDKKKHAANVSAADKDLSCRQLALNNQTADFEKYKIDSAADLKLKQAELDSHLEEHTKRVNNIRALIDKLTAALK